MNIYKCTLYLKSDTKYEEHVLSLGIGTVGALERYSEDPGSSPGGDACFHINSINLSHYMDLWTLGSYLRKNTC